jgi:hypothetical protein
LNSFDQHPQPQVEDLSCGDPLHVYPVSFWRCWMIL